MEPLDLPQGANAATRPPLRWELPPASPPASARTLPPPPPHRAARPSADTVRAGRTDHQGTIRRLKGASVAAAAVAVAAFGILVAGHHVGTASSNASPAGGQGSATTGATQVQAAAPVDPFFDPNPGSGVSGGAQPVFGGGGNGVAPAFQSSGS